MYDARADAGVVAMAGGFSAAVDPVPGIRAGAIGPVRREIVFEPLHERPAPVETPATPAEPAPKEPVPERT
jgi:hypothetical protein